jgi:hypothetical protein
METVTLVLNVLRRLLQQAGPYLALEIVLPGGTLIALALYLYLHRKNFFRDAVDPAPRRSTIG